LKSWKAEKAKLAAERYRLNQEYVSLKDEVKEVEQIRKGVHEIMREETRELQRTKAQGIV